MKKYIKPVVSQELVEQMTMIALSLNDNTPLFDDEQNNFAPAEEMNIWNEED